MTWIEAIVLIISSVGVLFMLISAIGLLRLPDVFSRMHAAGKAATLGVSCLLLAAGIFFGANWLWRMFVLILLFFVTAPIATTTMARAAYRSKLSQRVVLEYDDMHQDFSHPEQSPDSDRVDDSTPAPTSTSA